MEKASREEMQKAGLKREDAHDRAKWRGVQTIESLIFSTIKVANSKKYRLKYT